MFKNKKISQNNIFSLKKFLAHKIAEWAYSSRQEEYYPDWNFNIEECFKELEVALKKLK